VQPSSEPSFAVVLNLLHFQRERVLRVLSSSQLDTPVHIARTLAFALVCPSFSFCRHGFDRQCKHDFRLVTRPILSFLEHFSRILLCL
jgi:hypothetical protein